MQGWKDEESKDIAGVHFFSDNDLRARAATAASAASTGSGAELLKLDATGKAVLTILRHTGRIKNAPQLAKLTRYVVCMPAVAAPSGDAL